MDSMPEASTIGAGISPASPLTPKRIIRRLAIPKPSPSLELNALLDTQQVDASVQEFEASIGRLVPASNQNAFAAQKVIDEAPISRTLAGGGLADVSRRQALTPSKRQNQSSPGGRPKGKAGRLGKRGGRESFAAVKKLAGSLAKRASLSETENPESSEDGAAPETRDGQRRISAYFTPSLKKRSSKDEELSSPAKVVEERSDSAAERQVAVEQGGQVAAPEEGRVAAEGLPAADGVEGCIDLLKNDDCEAGFCGRGGEQEQGNVTTASGPNAFGNGGPSMNGLDSKHAGHDIQEPRMLSPGEFLQDAHEPPRTHQATGIGLSLSRGLQHCRNEPESGIGAQEGTNGPASYAGAKGSIDPGAMEAGLSTVLDTQVPVDRSAGSALGGPREPDTRMQEEMSVETMATHLQNAPLPISASRGVAADLLVCAPTENAPSELLASKPPFVGSCSPKEKAAVFAMDKTQFNCSSKEPDLLTESEIDASVPLSERTLVSSPLQKPISKMTTAPALTPSNLAVGLEVAPDLGRPAELSLDAIDEMCAALLADIEDLPTTVPFLGASPEPSPGGSPESPQKAHRAIKPSETFPTQLDRELSSSNALTEVTVIEGLVEQALFAEPSESAPNQLEATTLPTPSSPAVEVWVTERNLEQTVCAVPSTSEAEVAEAQWRRKLGERRRRGRMSVTDVCALEWCEMQVDFSTRVGKPAPTPVMQAGTARHEQLEREVITRVEVPVATREDAWALKLLNMITGLRQLATEGMTRELYILGRLEGHWVVGIIDELRLIERDGGPRTLLCDTKTRRTLKPPSDAQKRTGMLQLMCYKLLFDGLLSAAPFPAEAFFGHFALNARAPLSADVAEHAAAECALNVATLGDVLDGLVAECWDTPPADDTLLLRYEWQERRTVWAEDEFDFQDEWARERVAWHLDYWFGRRRPEVVPEDERWKCRFCAFRDACEVGRMVQSENGLRRIVEK